MTRGVQVVMSTRINSVLDALMSALIAVDMDTTWRFLTEYWVVVMDTTAIQEKRLREKQFLPKIHLGSNCFSCGKTLSICCSSRARALEQ